VPAGWIYVAGFGIRQMPTAAGAIVGSVGVGQDGLDDGSSFTEYIEKQTKLIESHLKEVKCAGPKATPFAGGDEAQLLFVRHKLDTAENMLHAQTYVRVGRWVGIITLTTLEAQLGAVRADYDVFVRGLRIGAAT
jgi:hypothetical protein